MSQNCCFPRPRWWCRQAGFKAQLHHRQSEVKGSQPPVPQLPPCERGQAQPSSPSSGAVSGNRGVSGVPDVTGVTVVTAASCRARPWHGVLNFSSRKALTNPSIDRPLPFRASRLPAPAKPPLCGVAADLPCPAVRWDHCSPGPAVRSAHLRARTPGPYQQLQDPAPTSAAAAGHVTAPCAGALSECSPQGCALWWRGA